MGLGESVSWTVGMHPTLNRTRWEATFTNPGGAAGTKYTYPLRFTMLSDYMSVEGETTNEWPGNMAPDGTNPGAGYSGVPILWRPSAIKANPMLCRDYTIALTIQMPVNNQSTFGVGPRYFAKVSGASVGTPLATTNGVEDTITANPNTLYTYDIVFGTTYTAGQTDTRKARTDSFTDWLDSFGYWTILGSSNKGFRKVPAFPPSGTPYDGFQFTFSGGSYRPTGTVSNVFTMTNSNSSFSDCSAASLLSQFNLWMTYELPIVAIHNGTQWLLYAPEPNGAYIQSCVSAETGDLYEHTVGSWDCITPTVFLPWYGVEVNSPVRSLPITAPTSITVERVALTT